MAESNRRFAGKSVVVTGVAKTNGIGYGTARVFAQEAPSSRSSTSATRCTTAPGGCASSVARTSHPTRPI